MEESQRVRTDGMVARTARLDEDVFEPQLGDLFDGQRRHDGAGAGGGGGGGCGFGWDDHGHENGWLDEAEQDGADGEQIEWYAAHVGIGIDLF